MKILLVSCHLQPGPQAVPLAAAILKAAAPPEYPVELWDLTLEDNPREAAEQILQTGADALGFSCYLWNRSFFEETARLLRESSEMILFAGGAEVTASAQAMAATGLFDYLLPGEGESSFGRLLPLLKKGRPPKCQILPSRPLPDLRESPSAVLQGALNPAHNKGMLWELSRGCPFQCAFCCESRGLKGVRYFDEERLCAELAAFRRGGVEQIFVLDPTFNVNKERALRLLRLFREEAPEIHFTLEIRAELIDQEMAAALSALYGSLQIGLQSADTGVMEKLNRRFDPEAFQRGISHLNTFGATFGLDLIYGLPGDTLAGFRRSLDFALFQLPNHLDIFCLSLFPGTQLYEEAASRGIDFEKRPPYHILGRPGFTKADLTEAQRLAEAADLFYNQGRAAGWFIGITEALELPPSEFLEGFADFQKEYAPQALSAPPPLGRAPYALQQAWLTEVFTRKGRRDLLPAARDFCLFHHLYAEVLHDPQGAARWGFFGHDPLDIGEAGIPDLEAFALAMAPEPEESRGGFFFLSPQGVEFMAVSKEHILLLEKLSGGLPPARAAQETAAQSEGFTVEDLVDFTQWIEESRIALPSLKERTP